MALNEDQGSLFQEIAPRESGHGVFMLHRAIFLGLILSGATASAGTMPAPLGTVTLPNPDTNAFSTSIRYDSGGTLYAWDGLSIWKQTGASFTSIGQVPAGNNADAGPINFSQDGTQIVVSNGDGGWGGGSYNGMIFSLTKAGGNPSAPVGSVAYNDDLIPVPSSSTITASASKYFVDQGNSTYNGSSVSVFDSGTGLNTAVIANIPGASAAMALNSAGTRLYADVGFGADAGQIRSFSLTDLASAFASNTPIDFSAGTLFNTITTPQSGAGMFFDKDAYLFVGGDGGVTVFSPNGTQAFVEDPTGNAYSSLAYNPATDQVLAVPYGAAGSIYNATSFETLVPEPSAALLLSLAGMFLLLVRARRNWRPVAGGPQ